MFDRYGPLKYGGRNRPIWVCGVQNLFRDQFIRGLSYRDNAKAVWTLEHRHFDHGSRGIWPVKYGSTQLQPGDMTAFDLALKKYAPDRLRTCGGGVWRTTCHAGESFHSRFLELKLPQFLMAGERWLGHWSDNFNLLLKNFVRVQSEHLPWQVCAKCVLVDTNNEVMIRRWSA